MEQICECRDECYRHVAARNGPGQVVREVSPTVPPPAAYRCGYEGVGTVSQCRRWREWAAAHPEEGHDER